VVLDASDGGKLLSLNHQGHEWLGPSISRDPHGPYAGGGGWDECIPTIAPCITPDGRQLADHGDAWRRGWEVVHRSEAEVITQVHLENRLDLVRHVEVQEGHVSLRYLITSAEAQPLHWTLHPLFAAPPGTQVTYGIPSAKRWVTTLGPEYPYDGRIDSLPLRKAAKLFVEGLSEARVTHPSGHVLTVKWHSDIFGYAGLYWDNQLFIEGTAVVAIEPTTGEDDNAAAIWDQLPVVGPASPIEAVVDLILE
jgi:hypothetical protein